MKKSFYGTQAANILFFPVGILNSKNLLEVSEELYKYSKDRKDYTREVNDWGRILLKPTDDVQISPAGDVWCIGPDGERLHLLILRPKGGYGVSNPGISGVVESAPVDLPEGSVKSKVISLLEKNIVEISFLYGAPGERVYTDDSKKELRYYNQIFPFSTKYSYEDLMNVVELSKNLDNPPKLYTQSEAKKAKVIHGSTSKFDAFEINWEVHPIYKK